MKGERRKKVQALALRPGTAGEGEAANAALERLSGKRPGRAIELSAAFMRRLDGRNDPGIYWDSDPKARGFGARLNAGGSITFIFNYRVDGHERRTSIGPYPRWSVAAARERVKELRKQIDRGDDPASAKRERREAPTIQDLVDRYLRDHLSYKAESVHADEKRMLKEIAKQLGKHTKIVDVNYSDVEAMHRQISESTGRRGRPRPVRANRVLSVCSKMFALALVPMKGETRAWRAADVGNPCSGVKKNPEQGRERFFNAEEVKEISAALDMYGGAAADCVRLCLLTGCRPGEAMKAQWTEFDAQPGYWIKPASNTKQRREHRLPLNVQAVELIDQLRKTRKSKNVFGRPGKPLAALHHVWSFVRRHTSIGNARLYDLRHSFASAGAAEKLTLPVIGKLLGHSSPKTTQRYVHLFDDLLRDATTKIGERIAGTRS
jgi:integrase